jgi:hypothetical protein
VQTLFRRFPDMELGTDHLVLRPNLALRGLESLTVDMRS